jgi:UDP-N-acetylglucosamine--N-acetylmuramyl-(pentapeptide) pyrophosphoryl-undecaprenol N-acetylglucosamine transferase
MTCAELSAIGLPAVFVPLPHGNGEQRLNALPIEAAGGGKIVPDSDLTPEWIARELLPILLDGELVAAMSRASASAGNPNADVELAALVLRAGQAGGGRSRPGHRRDGHRRDGHSRDGHSRGDHAAGDDGGQPWA